MKENITPLHGSSPKFTREVFEDIDDDDELDLDEESAALPERKRRDNVAVSGFGGGNNLPARKPRAHGGPTLEQRFGEFARKANEKSSLGAEVSAAKIGIRLWSVGMLLTGVLSHSVYEHGVPIPFHGKNAVSTTGAADPKSPAPTTTTTTTVKPKP